MSDKKAKEVKAQVVGAEDKPGAMAIVSLIAGILSILCHCVPIAGAFLGFILSVTAIVLGILEFNRIKKGISSEKGRGMAITGIILGGVGILVGIFWLIVVSIIGITGAFGSAFGDIFSEYW